VWFPRWDRPKPLQHVLFYVSKVEVFPPEGGKIFEFIE